VDLTKIIDSGSALDDVMILKLTLSIFTIKNIKQYDYIIDQLFISGTPLIFPIIGIIWGKTDFANPKT
jgi:hypothetical protein